MIPITIKTKEKEYKSHVPEGWHELNVDQFIQLQKEPKGLEVLAVLLNLPIEVVENAIVEISMHYFEWVTVAPLQKLDEYPREDFYLMGTQLKLPKKVEFTLYGQKSMLKALLHDKEDLQEIIPDVFALYAQPLIDGKFDSSRLEDVKEAVLKAPIIKVYPWVVFFFRRLLIWKTESQLN